MDESSTDSGSFKLSQSTNSNGTVLKLLKKSSAIELALICARVHFNIIEVNSDYVLASVTMELLLMMASSTSLS